MKILLCHNYYQQPGGEDQAIQDEARMLESHGHQVVLFTRHNDVIGQMKSLEIAGRTLWNAASYRELRQLIRRERPHIMHCMNTFPLISPAAYYAARKEGVRVVQELQNYRLLCPGAYFMRDGRVCEDCLGKTVPWPAVVHGCYRGSRAASSVVAGMLSSHRALKTWSRLVDVYCVLTDFARDKFIEGGLPREKLAIKPNFVHPVPKPGRGQGGYAVFVGRLSPEKGIDTLLRSWTQFNVPMPLRIVGSGPLDEPVRAAASRFANIEWLGRLPPRDVTGVLADAACLVIPSVWYEGLPKTIVEAFSVGTPVIASRLGAMAELIDDGQTGALVEPGSASSLAAAVLAYAEPPEKLAAMRPAVLARFHERFTAESNYRILMSIYRRALGELPSARRADIGQHGDGHQSIRGATSAVEQFGQKEQTVSW